MHPAEERRTALRNLRRLLASAADDSFFDLCWAVDALQSGQSHAASRYLSFPSQAADARFKSPLGVHPWELETLLGELFIAPKAQQGPGPNRVLNCRVFGAMVALINALRKLENAESGLYLRRVNILDELHRIAQRQFPWQSGYFNRIQFYRSSRIYGGPKCSAFFEERYGVSQNAVSALGFGLFTHFSEHPVLVGGLNLKSLGLAPKDAATALKLISTPIARAKDQFQRDLEYVTKKWGQAPPAAYRPSIFRRFPVVAFGPQALRSPLPELILERVTSGLYYDLLLGGQPLRNEASRRFELYCLDLLRSLIPSLGASADYYYWHTNQRYRSPDILGQVDGKLALVIECKASKLSFDAQYSEDPLTIARVGYDELAKGAFQLWRYFAHVRIGSAGRALAPKTLGLVLTLDAWMMMSRELRAQVLLKAEALAAGCPEILAEDKTPVVFCSVQDFERTLMASDQDGLFRAIENAATESFTGWLLADVHRDTAKQAQEKPYPFEMRDVLPWVQALDNEAMRLGGKPTNL